MRPDNPLIAVPAITKPESPFRGAGLELHSRRTPRAFHGFDLRLEYGPTYSPDTIFEGPAPAFRPSPARSTLAAPRTLADPVPERWSSRSLAVAPSYRLAAFLGRGDKMPRIRFYNRRSRHEHPPETPISETACRAPWGKPANVRLRDRSSFSAFASTFEQRRTTSRSSDLQRPHA